jgi:hypothetical protein
MFGIADFSRAIWMYGTLAHGAREAARFAIVRGDESGRAATADDVEEFVHNVMGLSDATVTTTWDPNNSPGSTVQVHVAETFVPAVPFFPSVPLSTRSRLVISF